jgi:hypothetical protein
MKATTTTINSQEEYWSFVDSEKKLQIWKEKF